MTVTTDIPTELVELQQRAEQARKAYMAWGSRFVDDLRPHQKVCHDIEGETLLDALVDAKGAYEAALKLFRGRV